MAVNPNTNRIESVEHDPELAKKLGELSNQFQALVRPDGTLVPKTWTVFKQGELIVIRDYTSRVAHIGEKHVLLEPVSPTDALNKQRSE